MNLAYLIPQFPSQTHAFFWREISAVRAQGNSVQIFSTRPPSSTCKHAFANEACQETRYLHHPEPRMVISHLWHPLTVFRLLRYVAGLKESSLRERCHVALLIPSALHLASELHTQRIDHLHVHSCAQAAHLAALCHLASGVSYSLCLHGDLPVYGKDHHSKCKNASLRRSHFFPSSTPQVFR